MVQNRSSVYLLSLFIFLGFCFGISVVSVSGQLTSKPTIIWGEHDLMFNKLAPSWDEGMPLGNGLIGALVWQKNDQLRMSLDEIHLWDLRPMENLSSPEFKFSWVQEHWKNNTYKAVQQKFDAPYDALPAPSKIPGAGLEFNIKNWGKVISARLSIEDAICQVLWENGNAMLTFVDATHKVGWFQFTGVEANFVPMLVPPAYNMVGESGAESPVTGQDLRRLQYPKGNMQQTSNSVTYNQPGWGSFSYQVHIKWLRKGNVLTGTWSISTAGIPGLQEPLAKDIVATNSSAGFVPAFEKHKLWWQNFWSKSALTIPDKIIEKQWYLEQYKFGCVARNGAPPISLQAVWTADNGKLPPWKGDYHHDLNTQLSYWPAYSANHLDVEMGFLNWMNTNKSTFKNYTKSYFGVDGLAVPGVTTLTGEPMGGWIQYSFGPTVSGWLGQHFYLHWRYSMDKQFLKEMAYPWIKDVAVFLDNISVLGKDGFKKLPLSSSPEYQDNSREAWFDQTTNFDLATIRWTYEKAAELATVMGKKQEAKKWNTILKQWPNLAIDAVEGLMIAPNTKYEHSHRHFSHLMAIHPYGIIDFSKGAADQKIIKQTVNHLMQVGTDYFTGYSFSWMAQLQARAYMGIEAANSLRIFAENFCLPNSFHVNGEQYNKGYSKFKYRPFTLEGNFAFASALQDMLIQSHSGIIKLLPAIPPTWQNVAFTQLRTEGAFLVSMEVSNENIQKLQIVAEKGGKLQLKNPFMQNSFSVNCAYTIKDEVITIETSKNQIILFTQK